MSEMVEQVARGLAEFYDYEFDELSPQSKDHWREAARAAIEAMREPTEAMIKAGLQHEAIDLASEYRAMINEALQ